VTADSPSSRRGRPGGRKWTITPNPLGKLWVPLRSDDIEARAIPGSENAKGCFTQLRCLLQDGVEHWLKIAGRGVDNAQHLGSGGLLLQSLPRLSDEPRILHRNDRLGREVLQQCDLLVGKQPNLLAV